MKRLIAVAAICVMSLPAAALAEGKDAKLGSIPVRDSAAMEDLSRLPEFPYTYAGLRYQHLQDKDDNASNGFVVEGSYLIESSLFAIGAFSSSEGEEMTLGSDTDSPTLSLASLGMGYRHDLTTNFDLVATVQAVQTQAKAFGSTDEESGYQVAGGVRGILFLKDLEGRADISWLALGDDGEAYLTVAGLYRVWSQLSAGLQAATSTDTQIYGVTTRWAF
jgi:hypothetical protein